MKNYDFTETRLRGIGKKSYYVYTIDENGEDMFLGTYKELSESMAISIAKLDHNLTEEQKKHLKAR